MNKTLGVLRPSRAFTPSSCLTPTLPAWDALQGCPERPEAHKGGWYSSWGHGLCHQTDLGPIPFHQY